MWLLGSLYGKFTRCSAADTAIKSSCYGRSPTVCIQREGKNDGKKSLHCFRGLKVGRKWQCAHYKAPISPQIHQPLFHLFFRTIPPSSYRPWLLMREEQRCEILRRQPTQCLRLTTERLDWKQILYRCVVFCCTSLFTSTPIIWH